jgi:hypothetical protein
LRVTLGTVKTTVAILLVSIFDYKFINEMMNEVEKAAENARNSGLLPGKSNQVYEIKLNNCCNCIVNIGTMAAKKFWPSLS